MIKVSVIMPVYNAEDGILTALDSVQKQTLKDIEIICVDDGSLDQSARKIKKASERDSRIKYYYQKNSGAGAARNLGILKAHGEYIAFLDADDCFADENSLEKLYTETIRNDVDICGGSAKFFNGQEPEKYKFHQSQLIDFKEYQFDFFFFRFLYKRELLVDSKVMFPQLRVYEDPIFLVKALYSAGKFYAIPDFVYLYSGSHTSADLSLEKTKDYLRGLTEELVLSSYWKYKKLHGLIFKRINETANYFFEKYLYTGDEELLSLLLQCNSSIDRELIKDICDENYVIPAIKTMWRAGVKYLKISNTKLIKILKKI